MVIPALAVTPISVPVAVMPIVVNVLPKVLSIVEPIPAILETIAPVVEAVTTILDTIIDAVNPRGTSIRCSGCGEAVPKTLADRQHNCACGVSLDRDHNAALNILRLGEVLRA